MDRKEEAYNGIWKTIGCFLGILAFIVVLVALGFLGYTAYFFMRNTWLGW